MNEARNLIDGEVLAPPDGVPGVLPRLGVDHLSFRVWGSGCRVPVFSAAGYSVGCSTLDFIRTRIYDKHSGSMKISANLDHISHCKTASGTN